MPALQEDGTVLKEDMNMMKLKRTLSLLCALLLALSGACLTASAEETLNVEDLYKSRDVRADWSADGATVIDLSALESGSDLTLTEEGDYVLSGEWTGRIVIEAGEEDAGDYLLYLRFH